MSYGYDQGPLTQASRQGAQTYSSYLPPNPERLYPYQQQQQQPINRAPAAAFSANSFGQQQGMSVRSDQGGPGLFTRLNTALTAPRGGKQYRSKSKMHSTNRKRKGGSKRKKNTRRRR